MSSLLTVNPCCLVCVEMCMPVIGSPIFLLLCFSSPPHPPLFSSVSFSHMIVKESKESGNLLRPLVLDHFCSGTREQAQSLRKHGLQQEWASWVYIRFPLWGYFLVYFSRRLSWPWIAYALWYGCCSGLPSAMHVSAEPCFPRALVVWSQSAHQQFSNTPSTDQVPSTS